MSSEPPVKTEICTDFQPQAWRKTLCVNCFHTKDEHCGIEPNHGDKSISNGDVKGSKKASAVPAPKEKKTTEPSKKSAGIKDVSTHTPGKTASVPKQPETKSKTEPKKPPPPVATKTTPDAGKQKSPAVTTKQSKTDLGKFSKPVSTVPETESKGTSSASSILATKGGKAVTSAPSTDTQRKQSSLDSKNTTSVNKPEVTLTPGSKISPILSNTSVKTGKTDEKSLTKTPSAISSKSSEDKKSSSFSGSDKHKASTVVSSQEDSKQKSTTDDESKTKPSKVLGLLKSFGTDESSDVKGSGVKEKSRSEKAEAKTASDVSKFPGKDSHVTSKGSGDQKHSNDVGKSPSAGQHLSSVSPSAGNKSSESIKNKYGDVTSQSKQSGAAIESKDLKGKSLFHSEPASAKSKDVEKGSLNLDSSKSKSLSTSSFSSKEKDKYGASKISTESVVDSAKFEEISKTLKAKESDLEKLQSKLKEMEEKVKKLADENTSLRKMAYDSKKEELEKNLKSITTKLASMETRCSKLQTDNTELKSKVKAQELETTKSKSTGSKEVSQLERDLEISDTECQQLKDENLDLRKEMSNLKIEMEEMYDTFKENEMDEFRELQKELDITAKNCRILQFKLRKSERRNEQIEADKLNYEDKLRSLQSQFSSDDAREHIESLEDDLKHSKDVSTRLQDEIDMLDDKKAKVEDENRQLTEILEQADKKQFRMEMDIDRLKDQIADLQQKVPRSTESDTRDRRTY